MTANENKLYYGDCLDVMKKYVQNNSIDLIYLDPPFNSNRVYNMFYKNRTGHPLPEQTEAFWDTWEWSTDKQELMDDMQIIIEPYDDLDTNFVDFWFTWIKALRNTNKKLLAYLMYMFVRLLEMKRILKETGSIYYHCDPTASHYIKVIMDGIFGHDNFRNEIVWTYRTGGVSKKWFPRKHDIILTYGKNNKNTYHNPLKETILYDKPFFTDSESNENGKFPVDVYIRDVWEDVRPIINVSKDRLGYPTQKPTALLDRIIKSSCPENGIVFDPFCGCGTTVYASHLNNRKWMGCDITIHAVNLIQETIENRYGLENKKHYQIEGIPTRLESAQTLMNNSPFEFEKWAVEYVKGFCTKKTGDKGVDGKIYFKIGKDLHNMVLSVKGGRQVNPEMVRELKGTMIGTRSQMAGLILLHEPTKGMLEEASMEGSVKHYDISYPKVQILTVKEMLESKKSFLTPNVIRHKEKTDDTYLSHEVKPVKRN